VLVTPTAAQPLSTIVPLDPMWVRFQVTESEYIAWTKRGRRNCRRTTDADPRRRLRVPRQRPRHRHAQPGGPQDRHAGTPGQLPQSPAHLLPASSAASACRWTNAKTPSRSRRKRPSRSRVCKAVYTVGPDNKALLRAIVTGNRMASCGSSSRASTGERIIVEGQLKVRPGATVAAAAVSRVEAGN